MEPPDETARAIATGYGEFTARFARLTRSARSLFEQRDWEAVSENAVERMLVYDFAVGSTVRTLRRSLGTDPPRTAGLAARAGFLVWAADRPDAEIAQTFFNSVVRRVYRTVGVDPGLEFSGDAVAEPPLPEADSMVRTHALQHGFAPALDRILSELELSGRWHERPERLERAARAIERELGPAAGWRDGAIEVLPVLFFRNKAAYVVGRVRRPGGAATPLVLAFLNPPPGLTLDAVLLTADEASVVFGFTRSYFHAETGPPRPVIEFLASIMPHRLHSELYTAIGYNRHGKTELYRTLLAHLGRPDARFEPAPGKRGLVMSVFTLPGLPVVFKVIRDRFGDPKRTTRERVRRSYELVFIHDRAGRLADAQSFEDFDFPLDRFSRPVLDDLLDVAGRTASVRGDRLHVQHLYTQRRVVPLDVFLEHASPAHAKAAVLDFGQAIRDMAAANLFPGDMLLKNFGVTRHGRVIFYDYDEVALLTSCDFRELPAPAYPGAELDEHASFHVSPRDVFPEEWHGLIGPPPPLRELFLRHHADLFDVDWWRGVQQRIRAGHVADFFPYPEQRRLG